MHLRRFDAQLSPTCVEEEFGTEAVGDFAPDPPGLVFVEEHPETSATKNRTATRWLNV
jgi:hypothetical protein